jgi:hypothetical protein
MTKPWVTQSWTAPYQLALLETNSTQMPVRIETAKTAIRTRIEELGNSIDALPELIALSDASRFLRILALEAN